MCYNDSARLADLTNGELADLLLSLNDRLGLEEARGEDGGTSNRSQSGGDSDGVLAFLASGGGLIAQTFFRLVGRLLERLAGACLCQTWGQWWYAWVGLHRWQ
jgi:hypothetical protein